MYRISIWPKQNVKQIQCNANANAILRFILLSSDRIMTAKHLSSSFLISGYGSISCNAMPYTNSIVCSFCYCLSCVLWCFISNTVFIVTYTLSRTLRLAHLHKKHKHSLLRRLFSKAFYGFFFVLFCFHFICIGLVGRLHIPFTKFAYMYLYVSYFCYTIRMLVYLLLPFMHFIVIVILFIFLLQFIYDLK